ncbi:VanZ family protein [Candidatus Pacearchaeota archaeon]|nr:VanZ family protein [Candidatus Pacearchaeota archaeon]
MIRYLEKKRFFALILAVLIAIEIFWFSSLSGKSTGGGLPFMAIAYHFIVFFELNFFLLITFISKNKIKKSTFFLVLVITVIYAILDEIHQLSTPFRSYSITDFLTDFSGITISSLTYLIAKRKTLEQKKSK